jgi:RHS repeat-associated protein
LERLEAVSGAVTQDLVSDIDYAPTGQPTLIRLGNGIDLDFTYDARSRLQTSVAGVEQDLTFVYDGVGNLDTVTDAAGDASAQFKYDDLYRLVEASGARFDNEIAEYRYDRRGNMVSKTFTEPTDPVHIGALTYGDPVRVHAVTAAAGQVFAYDAMGNLASDGQFTYAYTPAGMLASADDGAGALTDFVYDYANTRVHKLQGADSVTYVPAAGAELRTRSGTSRWIKTAVIAGRPVARVEDDFTSGTVSDHVFFFATDHLGSPTLVFDVDGDVIERAWTHPFGEENTAPLASAGTVGDYLAPADPDTRMNLRFQGRELDTETGFYDFGARIYRPDLGRFLTPDPVVPDPVGSQSWNRYAFVLNNPLRYVDPSGHGEEETSEVEGTQTREAQAQSDFETAMANEPLLRDAVQPSIDAAQDSILNTVQFDGGWTGDSQPWRHRGGLLGWASRWSAVTDEWYTEFANGTGPELRINWSLDNGFNRDLSDSWWMRDNILSFYYKNKENIEAGRPLSESWTQGRTRFSVFEVIKAGADPTEQYVGRFTVEAIYQSSPGMMRIVVSNDTSFTSLAYHLNDDWHWDRTGPHQPYSTVRQIFAWEQPISPPEYLGPMLHYRPTHGLHVHE